MNNHSRLVDDILFAVGSMPNVRCWVRNVGFDQNRKIKYGVVGESDIQGIISPSGRMIAIEVKTGSGKLSGAQKCWRDMIIKFGALYIEARSVEQVLADLRASM